MEERRGSGAFVVGVDFGTLSGRAVVVDAADGTEVGTAVSVYPHAVIEERLPATGEKLPPAWALQHPDDWLGVLKRAVPEAVRRAGIDPSRVVGIATDFTASTPLPVTADGTPLCVEFPERPHAYPKLWKHHAAQRQAERVTELAGGWITRYGGGGSSGWGVAEGPRGGREGPPGYAAAGGGGSG